MRRNIFGYMIYSHIFEFYKLLYKFVKYDNLYEYIFL